jgi:predicted MFS family arabinose efflux permease
MIQQLASSYLKLPRSIYALALATLVNRLGSIVQLFLFVYFVETLHWTVGFAGFTAAWFGVGSLVGSISGGLLGERYPTRYLLPGCLIANAVPLVLLPNFLSPIVVAAIVGLLGFFDGAFRPIYNLRLMEVCAEKDRAAAYALYLLAVNVGFMIAGLLGALLSSIGFYAICRMDAFSCVVSGCIGLFLMSRGQAVRSDGGDRQAAGHVYAGMPYRDTAFLALCGAAILNAFMITQSYTTYPTYLLEHYGAGTKTYGLLLTINGAVSIILQLPAATLINRWSSISRAIWGTFLLFLGFAILPFGSSLTFAVGTLLVWTIGDIIESASLPVVAMSLAERGDRGKYLSTYHSLYAAMYIVGPLAGAAVYDSMGGSFLWIGSGGLGLAAIVLLAMSRRFSMLLPKQASL